MYVRWNHIRQGVSVHLYEIYRICINCGACLQYSILFLLRLVIVPDHYWPISRYFQSRLSHHHLELLHSIPLGQKALNYIHHRTVVAAFLWYISEAESVCLVWWWPSRGPLKANISFFCCKVGWKKCKLGNPLSFFMCNYFLNRLGVFIFRPVICSGALSWLF